MNYVVVANVLVLLGLVGGLYYMQSRQFSFGKRVMAGLGLGVLLGAALQFIFAGNPAVIKSSVSWFDVIGNGYVRLLKMIVMPLLLVSITSAIVHVKDSGSLRKVSGLILGILLATTAISAVIGAGAALSFNLSAEGLPTGDTELSAKKNVEGRLVSFQAKPIQQQLIEIIPANPFNAMTGQGSSDTLSVVFFAALIGVAVLSVRKKNPQSAAFFVQMIDSFHDVVMRLVAFVLRLTPYGVLALMAKFVAISNFADIMKLAQFVVASYFALIVMFIIHLAILATVRVSPVTYIREAFPTLAFAFSSRTSAGTLPLTIETMVKKLGVPEGYANLAASFGTSIGQNGCAGIYPAMLAVMVAPTVGINPLDPVFLVKLVLVVALGSFGIAGVGGGATFAALLVLSTLGLPVGIVGLLIAIEPLIDMGRTALNVSDAMVAGVVTSKVIKAEEDSSVQYGSGQNIAG